MAILLQCETSVFSIIFLSLFLSLSVSHTHTRVQLFCSNIVDVRFSPSGFPFFLSLLFCPSSCFSFHGYSCIYINTGNIIGIQQRFFSLCSLQLLLFVCLLVSFIFNVCNMTFDYFRSHFRILIQSSTISSTHVNSPNSLSLPFSFSFV